MPLSITVLTLNIHEMGTLVAWTTTPWTLVSNTAVAVNPGASYAVARAADGEFVVHFDYAELKDLLRTNGPAALLPTVGN